ncbi:AAA family ATPase [Paraliomyxa miuraensis]|uniref:AAA family ATPase n=1 Tax=Paraliomyxa miuraensis TaxID=376150 RepID=UPI00224CE219|nr:AAA family ATPase [Paraliomyxa miuraensis]MCX4245872.1 AAA family ATPase [Paraliomyxa miuraensis]
MGIQKLRIQGFRSLRDVTWEPGALNVVIGPNGSGKSNLLRWLELLRQSARGELPKAILRMGGIGPLLWDGQAEEIAWEVRVDERRGTEPGDAFAYELCLRRLGTSSSYRVESERLTRSAPVHLAEGHAPEAVLERTPTRAVVRGHEVDPGIPEDATLLSFLAGPFSHPKLVSTTELFSGWSLYHDVHVDVGAPLRQAAVARMEHCVAADGQNLIPVLHTLYTGSREFKQAVDDAMRVAFNDDYEELVFPPAADQRVQLRVRWRSLRTEQSAADLSDGTIRFLLLLAILANPDPPSLIAIDEPETGLHPSMLPIVAEHAVEAATRTQVILTTHSAQLLDVFTATPPTTTVARWEDGETRLSVVDGEELQRWLHEYTLGALFRSGELEGMA